MVASSVPINVKNFSRDSTTHAKQHKNACLEEAPQVFGDLWDLMCDLRGIVKTKDGSEHHKTSRQSCQTRYTWSFFSCSRKPTISIDLIFLIRHSLRIYPTLHEGLEILPSRRFRILVPVYLTQRDGACLALRPAITRRERNKEKT